MATSARVLRNPALSKPRIPTGSTRLRQTLNPTRTNVRCQGLTPRPLRSRRRRRRPADAVRGRAGRSRPSGHRAGLLPSGCDPRRRCRLPARTCPRRGLAVGRVRRPIGCDAHLDRAVAPDVAPPRRVRRRDHRDPVPAPPEGYAGRRPPVGSPVVVSERQERALPPEPVLARLRHGGRLGRARRTGSRPRRTASRTPPQPPLFGWSVSARGAAGPPASDPASTGVGSSATADIGEFTCDVALASRSAMSRRRSCSCLPRARAAPP